jgi:hypothetical protein
MIMKILAFTACALLAAAAATPALAGPLDGASVHSQYLFPSTGDLYEDYGNTTVTGVTQLTDHLGGVPGIRLLASGSNLTASFADDAYGATFWNPSDFNGFVVFDDTNTAGAITSVTINGATNMVGFDASRISFDADHIYVNWQGLSFDNSTVVSLDLNGSGAVPEPASWALMLGGFGAIGGVMRSRKRVSAVSFG